MATASGAAIVLAARRTGIASAGARGRVQLGLTSPVYFNGFSPFLNWWKTASAPVLVRSSGADLSGEAIWNHGGYLDASSGEIVSPAPEDLLSLSRSFYKSANNFQVAAGCNYAGEEWTALWDGSAQGIVKFTNDGGSQVSVGSNQIDFTTGQDPDKATLVLTLTDRNDPPRNVRIVQARYRRNLMDGETFNPDWLAQIGQFGIIRFMGWMPTNNETIRDFSQLADKAYFAWAQQFVSSGKSGEFGPKGSMHPQLICELANQTRCNIHVCLPIRATDAFVSVFAGYFRDHTNVQVTYELSNECWNPGFEQFHYCRNQGEKMWPGDFWGFAKWYGYRSAECMNIIRDVYQDGSRWCGALATQTVDMAKTTNALAGVNYWRKNVLKPRRSLKISDLFKGLYVTGYFGFAVTAQKIVHITNAAPAVCLSPKHGFRSGQRIKVFVTDGPIQLNDRFATVANPTENSFELSGLSTVAMGAYLQPCRTATSIALPQSPRYDNGAKGVGAALIATVPGALAIGGLLLSVGDVILVKDQSIPQHNGIYRLLIGGDDARPWRLMRVSYFDRPSQMVAGSSVPVTQDAKDVYALDASIDQIGRDPLTFTRVEQKSYAVDATVFDLMDVSSEKHAADPVLFPSKHTYFNRQVAHACLYGDSDTALKVEGSIAEMEKVYWPRQMALAREYGLTLRQYEGGCGFGGNGAGLLGNPYAVVYGGNARFGEFVFNFGHSPEAAAIYAENYAAFWRAGGEYPAKFVADGRSSNVGTWAGVRFWPLKANGDVGDIDNPVWKATLAANAPR